MLNSFLFSFEFSRFCQSGCYFDFFYKKCSEVFIRHVFVYTSQFFAEKYMIETLTKRIIDNFLLNTNKWIGWSKLFYSAFFLKLISFLFYFLFFINLILLF